MLTRLAIVTAPALFVLLWSTGFIGARYGMPYIEPLTFLAVRMGFAVVIMAAIALLAGARRPSANEIGHSLVAGSLVHGLTLGGVFRRDQSGRTCRHFGTDPGAPTDRDFDIRHCAPPTFGPGFHKFPRALNESTDDRVESPMFQSDDPGGYLDA
jgi:EamA-like transporter family